MADNHSTSSENNNEVTVQNAANTPNNQQGKGRAALTTIVMSLIIAALGFAAFWFVFMRTSESDEASLYENIKHYKEMCHQDEVYLDSLESAYREYLDTYNSDAKNYAQVEQDSRIFLKECDDWRTVNIDSINSVQTFIDSHRGTQSFYMGRANDVLDSLSYKAALQTNSEEAFQHYIDQVKNGTLVGKHLADADKKLNEISLNKKELTAAESNAIRAVISNHFDAIADNDSVAVATTISSNISYYIGKSNPSRSDINAFMRNTHRSHPVIAFTVKNAKVTKVGNDKTMYNISFSLDEAIYDSASHTHINEDGEEVETAAIPTSVQHFNGTAVVNEGKLITSMKVEKVE